MQQQKQQQQQQYITPDLRVNKKRALSEMTLLLDETDDLRRASSTTIVSRSLHLGAHQQQQQQSLFPDKHMRTSCNLPLNEQSRQHQSGSVPLSEQANDVERPDNIASSLSVPTSLTDDDDENNNNNPNKSSSNDTAASHAPPNTRLRDIIGHDQIKWRLDELLLPLALPVQVARRIWTGIRKPAVSILFFGPPGCGKTQLAQAVAGEAQAAFLRLGPSDILSKYVGEAEAAVRQVFAQAWRLASRNTESRTTVLFWDEIDALGQVRGGGNGGGAATTTNSDGGRGILAELLLQFNLLQEQMSNFASDDREGLSPPRVILLAATNRLDDVDPALARRFGLKLHVGLPTQRDRVKILRRFLQGVDHALDKAQLRELADAMPRWSGSDLEHLTREAVMAPVRECLLDAARQRQEHRRRQKEQLAPSSSSSANKRPRRLLSQTNTADGSKLDDFAAPLNQGAANDEFDSDSGDDELDDDDDEMEQARQSLLHRLEDLRPVTFQDFVKAMDFILGQTSAEETEELLSPNTRNSI